MSVLDIGIQPPAIGWGARCSMPQSARGVALSVIVVTMLSCNFVGGGLLEGADPYA